MFLGIALPNLLGPNTLSPPWHAQPGIPVPWVALAGPASNLPSLLGAKAQPVPRRGAVPTPSLRWWLTP